jgi:hypothetical protein
MGKDKYRRLDVGEFLDGERGDMKRAANLLKDDPDYKAWCEANDPYRSPHLNPCQLHHGYVGGALIITSAITGLFGLIYILVTATTIWWPLIAGICQLIIGAWLLGDDYLQHARQTRNPEYRSPVNKLWGHILRAWRKYRSDRLNIFE